MDTQKTLIHSKYIDDIFQCLMDAHMDGDNMAEELKRHLANCDNLHTANTRKAVYLDTDISLIRDKTRYDMCLLDFVTLLGNPFLVQIILDYKHTPTETYAGFTPLHFLSFTKANYKDISTINKLLSPLYYKVENPLEFKTTPLHCAAKCLNLNAVKVFIESGCDVNQQNALGLTALHFSCLSTHLSKGTIREDVMEYLLKHGADMRLSSVQNGTVGDIAASKNFNLLGLLIVNGFDPSMLTKKYSHDVLLSRASQINCCHDFSIVRALIELGYKFRNVPRRLENNVHLQQLLDMQKQAPSLQRICGNQLRHLLLPNITEQLLSIDIPLQIKDFITFKHIIK